MQNYTASQIRRMFLDFFQSKGHLKMDSASLIPFNDPSLLLINSGMAQFKPYFSGQEIPPSKRVTTCQKCIRTNDIDNVGKTSRHATFFEMLGNFSFGDYFKKEAISWAWEFITQVLKLPQEKLFVTVYKDDTEAFDIWHNNIGLPKEKIFCMDKDDNFWEIGVGPCGPCSEIYFDRGSQYGCKNCHPGCDCDRFVEIWNLVFTQFNHNSDGSYSKLNQCNIDTGMGLERISTIMQNVDSIFDIDCVKSIRDEVCRLANVKYNEDKTNDISIRIVTDHIKAIVFMISDGILPANDGRGYVLKRLIRRAICHGKHLGINNYFLSSLADIVIKNFKDAYPALEKNQICDIISQEEKKFSDTLAAGMNMLTDIIDDLKSKNKKIISGATAFRLYDTFGFPMEIAREIAEKSGIKINEEEYEKELENQKQRAKSSRQTTTQENLSQQLQEQLKNLADTKFVGYETNKVDDAKILAIIDNNELKNETDTSEKISIILDKTPFFAESSGQIADNGILKSDTATIKIIDCKKILGNKFEHIGKIIDGKLKTNQTVSVEIDAKKRLGISRNHTATHLLHKALQDKIDKNIKQMGSYVDENRLRFDFLCPKPLTKSQLELVEATVNEKIFACLEVTTSQKNIDDAIKSGATALFGEKYSNVVRVVNISDYSIELCSGTHLKNTSQAGIFKIISEGSISSGIRRIEAVTGEAAYKYLLQTENVLDELGDILKTNKNNLAEKATKILNENKKLEASLQKIKLDMAKNIAQIASENAEIINGLQSVICIENNSDVNFLRCISDEIKNKLGKCTVFILSNVNGKINVIASSNNSINVGQIVKNVAMKFGGKGGGKLNNAQAGGLAADNIDEIINEIKQLINKDDLA